MNNLKGWLRTKIEERGISISKLADETGLTRAIIYFYMSDVNRPTQMNLQKICDVLGADINEAMALYTPKKVGRPIGSVKRWGAVEGSEVISENIKTDIPNESNKLPEYTDL